MSRTPLPWDLGTRCAVVCDGVLLHAIAPVVASVLPSEYAVIHYVRADGDYGDHTTGNFQDFWGLHLWGAGIDPGEETDWTAPKPFLGETEYGRFAWIQVGAGSGAAELHRAPRTLI